MNRAVGFWLAVLLVFAGGMLLYFARNTIGHDRSGSARERDESSQVALGPTLTEFELTDQTGARLHSNELLGKVWGGSIFFASCPSTCYNQNIKLQQLLDKYADQGLVLVSITCDPANDTPSALSQYSSRFNANVENWKFLTTPDGGMDYLRRIGRDFLGVTLEEEAHSDRVVLYDRDGTQKGAFSVLDAKQYQAAQEALDELFAADTDGGSATSESAADAG